MARLHIACVAGSLGLGEAMKNGKEKKLGGGREGEPAVMPRYFSCFAGVRGRRILLAYWYNICKFISPEVF